jgi:hypothetical protein
MIQAEGISDAEEGGSFINNLIIRPDTKFGSCETFGVHSMPSAYVDFPIESDFLIVK